MTLENMNALRFSPKKDYSANRLLAGSLQLSSGKSAWGFEIGFRITVQLSLIPTHAFPEEVYVFLIKWLGTRLCATLHGPLTITHCVCVCVCVCVSASLLIAPPPKSGTNLVLDETAMVPGRLDEAGLRNLEALGCLVQWQKVRYDFHFHTADFDCDIVSGRSCDFITLVM